MLASIDVTEIVLSLSCAAMISPVTLVALDREREAARGHARGAGDGTVVPSCSVFQACHGRAGGLIARDSRFEVAPPMFSGRLDSLLLRDATLSFPFLFVSFSLSFPSTFSAISDYT